MLRTLRAALPVLLLSLPIPAAADKPAQPDDKKPADKPVADVGIRMDYANEIKGDRLHKGKTMLVSLAFGDVNKATDGTGRYLLRSVWFPDLQRLEYATCCVYLIEADKAAPFADLGPGAVRLVVRATCVGKVSGNVCFIDAEFVRLEK